MDSLTIIFILNGVFFISLFILKNIFISLGLSVLSLFILLFIGKQQKTPTASVKKQLNFPTFTFSNNQYVVTIVCLVALFILQIFIGFTAALFVSFFIFVYLNKLDARASFFIALILLVITALLSISGNTKAGEDTAILAYYFLVVGVIWQIIELRKEKSVEEEIVPPPKREKEKIKVISNTFMRQYKSTPNFFTGKNFIIAGIFIFTLFVVASYIMYSKYGGKKNATTIPTKAVIPTPTLPPPKHAPLAILNATYIKGHAASSAAVLRAAGWESEFDITTGNYEGTASSDILRYTKNLEEKVQLLEHDLNIQITPIIIKDATRATEMTLILGK